MAMTPENSDDPIAAIERDTAELKKSFDQEKGAATEAWHDARDTARQKASDLAAEAKAAAYSKAEGAQRQASASLHTFAEAVRTAGEQLAEKEQGTAARLVREAAGGLEQLSNTLAQKSVEEIIHDARDFGRRNPTAFIAGTVLAGIALGRFVRSTASDKNRSSNGGRMARNADYGRGSGHVEIGARPGASPAAAPRTSTSETMSGRTK